MRKSAAALLALALGIGSAQAQDRPGGGQRLPPDHWLTLDSLVMLVGITDEQRPSVAKRYEQINGVMKKAADERRKMFEQMGGQRPTPEQMQATRAKFEFMQTDLDKHYKGLRDMLAAEQRVKFDSLPKPRVMPQRGQRPGG